MPTLAVLSRDGAIEVLRQLSIGEARFRELNDKVRNTRTLTRRLSELVTEGLIRKAGIQYKITSQGFKTAFRIAELEGEAKWNWLEREELAKIKYGWMRISLSHLTRLFHDELQDELVSIVLYGSAAKGSFQLGRSDIDLLYILEDGSKGSWQREGRVFKRFRSAWEYKASDHWLRTQGFYGYPEVTTASLRKSQARAFQPTYLDMLSHRVILYDRGGFFLGLMEKLREALVALGTIRVEHMDGTYMWFLKPDLAPGELLEIDLG